MVAGAGFETSDLWVMSPFQIETGANRPQTTLVDQRFLRRRLWASLAPVGSHFLGNSWVKAAALHGDSNRSPKGKPPAHAPSSRAGIFGPARLPEHHAHRRELALRAVQFGLRLLPSPGTGEGLGEAESGDRLERPHLKRRPQVDRFPVARLCLPDVAEPGCQLALRPEAPGLLAAAVPLAGRPCSLLDPGPSFGQPTDGEISPAEPQVGQTLPVADGLRAGHCVFQYGDSFRDPTCHGVRAAEIGRGRDQIEARTVGSARDLASVFEKGDGPINLALRAVGDSERQESTASAGYVDEAVREVQGLLPELVSRGELAECGESLDCPDP